MSRTSEANRVKKAKFTPDWLVGGVLSKIGDIFDRMTGRGYKPSSTLATSELIERLKFLLDSEARDENGRLFVPHNIKLRMQWDKFSTDAEDSLRSLEHEFLTAAVDHVNDKRYYTKAPFRVEAKPDYFTSGVKLFVSFEKLGDGEREAAVSVAVPGATQNSIAIPPGAISPAEQTITVKYSLGGNAVHKELRVKQGERLSVGRTKENNLAIDDPSLSKYHASLMLDREHNLLVADTGSTNGTFINGERIAYGKAVAVTERDKVRFGLIDIEFQYPPKPVVQKTVEEIPETESFKVGEFEFSKRTETIAPATASATIAVEAERPQTDVSSAPTVANVSIPNGDVEAVAPQPQLTLSSIELSKEDEIEIP